MFKQLIQTLTGNKSKKRNAVKPTDRIILIPEGLLMGAALEYNTVQDLINLINSSSSSGDFWEDVELSPGYKVLRNKSINNSVVIESKNSTNTSTATVGIVETLDNSSKISLIVEDTVNGKVYSIDIEPDSISIQGIVRIQDNLLFTNMPVYISTQLAQDDPNLPVGALYNIGGTVHVKIP